MPSSRPSSSRPSASRPSSSRQSAQTPRRPVTKNKDGSDRKAPSPRPKLKDFRNNDVVYVNQWPCILRRDERTKKLVAHYLGAEGTPKNTDRLWPFHIDDENNSKYRNKSFNVQQGMDEAKRILRQRKKRWGANVYRTCVPTFVTRHLKPIDLIEPEQELDHAEYEESQVEPIVVDQIQALPVQEVEEVDHSVEQMEDEDIEEEQDEQPAPQDGMLASAMNWFRGTFFGA